MHKMCYYHDHDIHQAVLPTSSSWPRNSAMTPTAGKNSQVSPISSSFLLHSFLEGVDTKTADKALSSASSP